MVTSYSAAGSTRRRMAGVLIGSDGRGRVTFGKWRSKGRQRGVDKRSQRSCAERVIDKDGEEDPVGRVRV